MNLQKTKAFTLVELIVVITILAILGTIAFISMQGYAKTSRDSVRINDISTMKTSLELFHLDAGKYPLTDNGGNATYSGELLWTQGTIGYRVINNLSRNLNKIPTDPLSGKEYIYSVTWNRNEFQLLNLLEGDDLVFNSIPESNAATDTRTPRVEGQYNGLFVKRSNLIFPTPTIINSLPTLNGIEFKDNDNILSQIVSGGKNLPLINTGNLDINLSVFTGSITDKSTDEEKAAPMKAIQGAYSGSTLADLDIYKVVLSKSSDTDLAILADTIILSNSTAGLTSSNDTPVETPVDTTPPSDYIAYYPLTGTAEDMTGNYDGTEFGNTYIADSIFGSVAYLDGINDRINIPSSISSVLNYNNNFTISSWINPKDTDFSYVYSLGYYNSGSDAGRFRIYSDLGNIYVNVGWNNNQILSAPITNNLGDFNNILIVGKNNGTIDIYNNSILVETLTVGDWTHNKGINLGANINPGEVLTYNGDTAISNIKIFNRGLSQTEITNIYNAEKDTSSIAVSNGLVAYYPLKGNSKDNWYREFDAISTGGYSFNGITGVDFNGTNGEIKSIGLAAHIDGTVSYSFWYKVTNGTTNNGVGFNTNKYGYGGLQIRPSGNTGKVYYNWGGTGIAYTEYGSSKNDGNWHNVIITRKASTGRVILSVDNIEISNIIGTTGSINESGEIRIGYGHKSTGDDYWFDGSISNVRIYDIELSSENKTEIYNLEKGDFGL